MLLLTFAVTAAAFLSMVVPNLTWKSESVRMEARYLPQLIFGFIGLIVLFNLYVFEQKRKLDRVREQLTIRLVCPDSEDTWVAVDPQTKLFPREFVSELLSKEAHRAERARSPLTVVVAEIKDYEQITREHGSLAADHLLLVTARILKTTFRGSDTLCRYGHQEFLVILPDTTPTLAQFAIARLERAVEGWNSTTEFGYKIKLLIGVAAHTLEIRSAPCETPPIKRAKTVACMWSHPSRREGRSPRISRPQCLTGSHHRCSGCLR